jgi:hypothetical protein
MLKAASVHSTPRTSASEFHLAVNRIRLSQMIRDPFVSAAFRAAEDDGLTPDLVETDHPKTLDGGAVELVPADGRRIAALVEG